MEKASSKARCQSNYSLHLDTCSSEILSKKKVEPQETKMFPSENVLTATMSKLWILNILFFFFCHFHVCGMCHIWAFGQVYEHAYGGHDGTWKRCDSYA